jgi:FKBP-type peptidyl-prolyl cis-trans isomerase
MRIAAVAAVFGLTSFAVAQDGIPPLPEGKAYQDRPSGLRFVELVAGDGKGSPSLGDKVRVYYKGWLADGTVFDERPASGAPAEFTCGGLIKGWNEALQSMSAGSSWRIECPPDLAYGPDGRPPRIPAAATLTFELTLVGFTGAPKFQAFDAEKAVKTDGGFEFQELVPGTGAAADADKVFKLRYAVWDLDGNLMDSTFQHGGTIDGRIEDMRLPFLKEVPLRMKVGGAALVRATKEQCFPDGAPPGFDKVRDGVTVWRLELAKVIEPMPTPAFAVPDAEKSITLDSGLVYEVLKEGEGTPSSPTDLVQCHYAGWLEDGTLFDASFPRGEPLEIRGVQVIPGWTEALKRMKPGAVWRLKIPADIGYGEAGSPPVIPGGATLIFHVELIGPASGR